MIAEQIKKHFIIDFGEKTGLKFYTSILEHLKNVLNSIDNAIQKEDSKELSRNFHSLKGLLLQAGLKNMAELAYALEKDTIGGLNFNKIKPKKDETLIDLVNFLESNYA
jgi:HPt (histidine-containing phosphotransfer) domain-containing protein